MNKLALSGIVVAIGLTFSAGTMAESMSKTDYKAGKAKIAAEYAVANEKCDIYAGAAKDRCVDQANLGFGK